MKVADLEILELLHRLPPDAALLTEEAAVFLRCSPRTLERMRASGEGPRYQQSGGAGSRGVNQKCTYLIRDLKAWQEKMTVSSSVAAAVRKGQLFVTLADVAEERPFWRSPKGQLAGLVEETSVDIFIARIGKWGIEWLPADQAAADNWESLLSQRTFAAGVSNVLRNCLGSIEAGLEESELRHSVADAAASRTDKTT
jgi:hypothetical protein